MKRISISRILLGLLTAIFLTSVSSAEVVKVVVNDTIQPITEEYISRAIDEAQRRHAQAVLIEINTPGGLVESTRHIIEKITTSDVPVIIYVSPSGSRAGSAGIFILEAADVAAMAPGTNAGAAHPVLLFGPTTVKPDDEMKQKIENDSAALMRSVVSRRGRNIAAAESAVRESKSFTDQEALQQHLIDYIAPSEQDLFRQMAGKPFKRFNGQEVTLNLVGQPVEPFGMTLKEEILNHLMDPNISFIFLAIGALALYAEFNHPGAVIPGTVGVVFILIALFALNLLPTRFAALSLILGAFALFAAEAKFATHGVLTVGGIALITLGGLLLVDSPIPEMRVHLLTALAVSIPLGVITAFLMTVALRARRNKLVSGAQGMVGESGIAQNTLSPRGKVFVHGELWDAVSSSEVSAGQSIVVRRVDGLELEVEALPAAKPAASPVAH
ncbi:MAG: NfeD family protein [Candidatus Sulfotelmatobacter sp.]